MKLKLTTESPCGKRLTQWIHSPYAWEAARGIATRTHAVAVLHGRYGIATFDSDGGGVVEWGPESTCPGERSTFADNCTVCIN